MEPYLYRADVVERATRGATLKIMNNWAAKNEWLTPLEEVSTKGKARRFSRLNVLEAALVTEMMRSGLSRNHATQAMARRAQIARDIETGYVDLVLMFSMLPELKAGSKSWHWAIFMKLDPESGEGFGTVPSVKAFRPKDISKLLEMHHDDTFLHLPVSAIVARVDAELARADSD